MALTVSSIPQVRGFSRHPPKQDNCLSVVILVAKDRWPRPTCKIVGMRGVLSQRFRPHKMMRTYPPPGLMQSMQQ